MSVVRIGWCRTKENGGTGWGWGEAGNWWCRVAVSRESKGDKWTNYGGLIGSTEAVWFWGFSVLLGMVQIGYFESGMQFLWWGKVHLSLFLKFFRISAETTLHVKRGSREGWLLLISIPQCLDQQTLRFSYFGWGSQFFRCGMCFSSLPAL